MKTSHCPSRIFWGAPQALLTAHFFLVLNLEPVLKAFQEEREVPFSLQGKSRTGGSEMSKEG